MAAEPFELSTISYVRLFPWVRLFRAVGLAFDSKKILLAALGLVGLGLGWEGLDRLFPASSGITPEVFGSVDVPDPGGVGGLAATPGSREVSRPKPETLTRPSGTLSRRERGIGATLGSAASRVAEPALYLSRPFLAVFAVGSDLPGFLHALLAAAWGAAVWGVIGGAILRIAFMQVARDERVGIGSSLRFALRKWAPLVGAPLSPLLAVFLFAALCGLLGLAYRIPAVGPVLSGLLAFLPLLAGLVMAIILLGLAVGWPLMHATIAAEGEDGFDALSRAYAYVNGRPGRYASYLLLAWGLGTLGVAFVDVLAQMVVHLARWGLSFGAPDHALDVLFRPRGTDGSAAAALHASWLWSVGLLAHSWAYSFFWSASAIIYLLLRHDVDGTAWDDVARPEHEADVFAPEPPTIGPEGSGAVVDPLPGGEPPAVGPSEPNGSTPADPSLPAK